MLSPTPALALCTKDSCDPNFSHDCDDVCQPVVVGGKTVVVCNLP